MTCAFLTEIETGVLGGTGRFETFINSCTKEFQMKIMLVVVLKRAMK